MKLHVRATPNARLSEILGWEVDSVHGQILRVKIAAPAQDGLANKALRDFLAVTLKCPKSQIILQKGGASRQKTFEVPDSAILPPMV